MYIPGLGEFTWPFGSDPDPGFSVKQNYGPLQNPIHPVPAEATTPSELLALQQSNQVHAQHFTSGTHPKLHSGIGHPNSAHAERPSMLPSMRVGKPKRRLPAKTRTVPSGKRR